MTKLTDFYLNEAPNSDGRMWEDMMKFKHAELEYIHDYIQWLFPSPQPSMFNSDAPLLTQEDIILFNTDPVLREHLLEAFKKILDFYGFELQEGMQGEIPTLNIVRSSDWEGAHQWLEPYNHNYLRITRILMCLKLCGLRAHALAFCLALNEVYKEYGKRIGERTLNFWKEAVS